MAKAKTAKENKVVGEGPMESASDFLNDAEHVSGLSKALATELVNYVDAYVETKKRVAEAEAKLAEEVASFKNLSESVIPEIMARAHLTELRMDNGHTIVIKEDLKVSIPKDAMKRKSCMDWLRFKKLGDAIKQAVNIQESETQKVSQKLLDLLTKEGISYERTEDVHSSTLKALFREQLGLKEGAYSVIDKKDVPAEFNLFLYRVANIS